MEIFFMILPWIVIFGLQAFIYYKMIYYSLSLNKEANKYKKQLDKITGEPMPILPNVMTQEEVNKIDDSIDIDKFMKTTYKLFKEYEEAKQHFDYDKLELLLGHDLKVLTIEEIEDLEKHNEQLMYKNMSYLGGGIYHIYQYGPIQKIDVLLHVTKTNYIISRKSKNVLSGDRNDTKRYTYHLTLERTMNGYPSNCPNCGASLEIDDEAKCVFCGSHISSKLGDYKMIYKEVLREEDYNI